MEATGWGAGKKIQSAKCKVKSAKFGKRQGNLAVYDSWKRQLKAPPLDQAALFNFELFTLHFEL
jgi:hypothetical protein